MSKESYQTILKIEGENPDTGWQLEFSTNQPLELPGGTKAFSARIARADGKYHTGEYLPANSDYNPAGYGQLGIVERGKQGIVGSIVTILSRNQDGQVMIAFTESHGRLGNRGVKPMLESKRGSADNSAAIQSIGEYTIPIIDHIYSNNARITGDQPDGAPINVGTLFLREPSADFEWKSVPEFVSECQEAMSLASLVKSLGQLGLLNQLILTPR